MKFIALFLLVSASGFGFETQLEMNEKAHIKAVQADTELNSIYKQLIEKLTVKEKANMLQAQRAWIRFRDAQCRFEWQTYEGGSIAPLNFSECFARMTRARTKELKELLKDYDR